MTEVLIIGSRYLFVILALLFTWESILYVLYEREIRVGDLSGPIKRQRILILLFYIVGYAILILKSLEESNEQALMTGGTALLGLIFFVFLLLSSKAVFQRSCLLLWNCVFFLFVIGLITIQRLNPERALRQIFFASFGYVIALLIPIVLKIFKSFSNYTFVYFAICVLLLLSLFIFGKEINGAKNWIYIGPISFQPSEFVKVFYCLFLASTLKNATKFVDIIIPSMAAAGIVFLLVLQNDFGGALLFFIVFLLVFFASTGRITISLLAVLLFIAAGTFSYYQFSHVTRRFNSWLNPWADPYGVSYQVVQSLFALSSFGLWGIGLTKGLPLDIPYVETDFIFAAIGEEFGAIFGLFIIGLYILLFYRGVNIALRNADAGGNSFYSLLAVGIVGMLATQCFVILGGVTGLTPITGVTLPFISYGGSSVFISFIMIGILQWLHSKKEMNKERKVDG